MQAAIDVFFPVLQIFPAGDRARTAGIQSLFPAASGKRTLPAQGHYLIASSAKAGYFRKGQFLVKVFPVKALAFLPQRLILPYGGQIGDTAAAIMAAIAWLHPYIPPLYILIADDFVHFPNIGQDKGMMT